MLSLEGALGRWLPPMRNTDPAITVRQLLNHRSGLADGNRR
jgi:CubicO group peptidase (beta-lactamase class C family)